MRVRDGQPAELYRPHGRHTLAAQLDGRGARAQPGGAGAGEGVERGCGGRRGGPRRAGCRCRRAGPLRLKPGAPHRLHVRAFRPVRPASPPAVADRHVLQRAPGRRGLEAHRVVRGVHLAVGHRHVPAAVDVDAWREGGAGVQAQGGAFGQAQPRGLAIRQESRAGTCTGVTQAAGWAARQGRRANRRCWGSPSPPGWRPR